MPRVQAGQSDRLNRPHVLVRADVNTDATAATMDVIGREHRVCRARSRPCARRASTARSDQPATDPATIKGRLKAIKAVLGSADHGSGEAGRSASLQGGVRKGRDSEPSCEGCGESPHSVRPTRTLTARPQAPRVSRSKRVRLRITCRRVRGQLQDIRTIQPMLGHADIKQTQRYLNITDAELRKAMTGVWRPASAESRRSVRLKADTTYES